MRVPLICKPVTVTVFYNKHQFLLFTIFLNYFSYFFPNSLPQILFP